VKVSLRSTLIGTVVALSVSVLFVVSGGRLRRLDNHGIPPCPAGAPHDLLAANALQCWLTASHGRWRTLSHQEAYGALVVEVEAVDLADADEIARRFVDGQQQAFSEMSIYVQRESSAGPTPIRRVRWTPEVGFETLDFTAPAAR
jgi:hypothetical protein